MSQSEDAMVPGADAYEHVAELDLAARPLTARDARHAVGGHLRAWGVDKESIDVVMLLTSEVVTNATRHAPPPVHLVVRHGSPGVRVEVEDSHPALNVPERPDLEDHGGRGLWLVQMMSTRWGHHEHHAGKVVWFDRELTR